MVDHAKIDWRTGTLTLIQLKKILKEKYMQLLKEKGCGEDEVLFQQAKTVQGTKI